jgi:diguanylate cyclase (GGDEF)-like protein/PAS domain S-box-containing protein
LAKISRQVLSLFVLAGLFLWVFSATLDFFIFKDRSFWDLLILDVQTHIVLLRLFGLVMFVSLGLAMSTVLGQRERAEEALKKSETKYRTLTENINTGIYRNTPGPHGRFLEANPAIVRMFGFQNREEFLEIRVCDLYCDPSRRAKLSRKILERGFVKDERIALKRKDGTRIWCSVSASAVYGEDGKVEFYDGVIKDITKRKLAEDSLVESRRRIESLHHTARLLASCVSEYDIYELTVEAAERILGFRSCTLAILEEDDLVVKAAAADVPHSEGTVTRLDPNGLAARAFKNGRTIVSGSSHDDSVASKTIKTTDEAVLDMKSTITAPIAAIGVFMAGSEDREAFTVEDVRLLELLLGHAAEAVQRIRLQEELKFQATRDPLTGVYNRRYFTEVIEKELQRSTRYEHQIGFLMIDIDGFKEINDTHGHQTGDQVLKAVASFLHEQIRTSEMVVRYGGDEFLVVMPETRDGVGVVKSRIRENLIRWNQSKDGPAFTVELSMGGAYWSPGGPETVESVLAAADRLMYEDKRSRTACRREERTGS